ncbi:MAG: hypothetical protein RLZZ618_2143 [Pseudomonadota bacterium]|jgi:hypothetical protein
MTTFYVVLALLAALNIWATRRVIVSPGPLPMSKGMLVAYIWVVPLFGALMAKLQAPSATQPQSVNVVKAPENHDAAPETITGSDASSFSITDHLGLANGIPLLDWTALDAWAHSQASASEAVQLIDQGRHAWLLHLRDAIGPQAHVHVTDDVYILSALEPNVVKATAAYVATAKRRISRVLSGLAQFPAGERSILLVLESQEAYYHYVSTYYPDEGEFAISGGMFIHAGCPHFVVVEADLQAIEPVLAHELTHSALNHLRLPKWIDEGLAVNTEHKLTGARPQLYTRQELHQMHQRFWTPTLIQEFWSGASFLRTDDGNLLSYELARIITEHMGRDWDRFVAFVRSAQYEDAGASSALTALSMNLGAYASSVLGIEAAHEWGPDPQVWMLGATSDE